MFPRAGEHYPANYRELQAWFPDDQACLDYLGWLRWGSGFQCPRCGELSGWRTSEGSWKCRECRHRVTTTAGTVFNRTRTPLTLWFEAAWVMATPKNGVSALALQRSLALGSYETAWAMLHRYRLAMGSSGTDRLHGDVEVDETFLGGATPGKRGRTPGAKILVAVAVELLSPKGLGRCRLRRIDNAQTPALRNFLLATVEPGSLVITDGLKSYPAATVSEWRHKPVVVKGSGLQAHQALPGVHRVASLLKRWLGSTHQGSVEADHLQAYLDEFTFRFNRRKARSRGLLFYRLLELATATAPARYEDIVADPGIKSRKVVPVPPTTKRVAAGTLAMVADHPWLQSEPLARAI
jgi:transposase-like protein